LIKPTSQIPGQFEVKGNDYDDKKANSKEVFIDIKKLYMENDAKSMDLYVDKNNSQSTKKPPLSPPSTN